MITINRIQLIVLLPLLLNACGILTVRGSGNVVTETRDVHNFDRVVISGTNEVKLTQGLEESLTVTTDANLMNHIESEVRNGTLFIGNVEGISPSQPILFKLNVKEIIGLEVGGFVSVETGNIATERLDIDVSGISTLRMGKLETQNLTVHLSGSTMVELTDPGKVVEQKIVLSGSNTYHAPNLHSQRTEVSISGSGDATVLAIEVLNVVMSGNGSVNYFGSPQVSQSGSGNVDLKALGNP
jgi:hypothetical protein